MYSRATWSNTKCQSRNTPEPRILFKSKAMKPLDMNNKTACSGYKVITEGRHVSPYFLSWVCSISWCCSCPLTVSGAAHIHHMHQHISITQVIQKGIATTTTLVRTCTANQHNQQHQQHHQQQQEQQYQQLQREREDPLRRQRVDTGVTGCDDLLHFFLIQTETPRSCPL